MPKVTATGPPRHVRPWYPRSFCGMHTQDVTQCILPETASQNLCGTKRALYPMTPHNPYLEGVHKNEPLFGSFG